MTFIAALRALIIGVACIAATATSVNAATSDWVGDARGEVRLVTAAESVNGGPIKVGIEFQYPPGWHGYWRTPGDAGIAPVFDWSNSVNVRNPSVSWPAPSRLVVSGLQNSIYQGRFILPVSLNLIDQHAKARIALSIDYAACANICIPKHADLTLDLPTGSGKASPEAVAIAAATAAVPRSLADSGIQVTRSEITGTGTHKRLYLTLRSGSEPFRSPDLFIEGASGGLPPSPDVHISDEGRVATLVASVPAQTPPSNEKALVLTIVDGARAVEFAGPQTGVVAPAHDDGNIFVIIASALLGGLILNLMPCVLPILSIKLFGLARYAGAERRAARQGAIATALGIVSSFLLLAAVLSGLKLSGTSLGWGIQFQQPWFLASMAAVTTLFAASFFEWLPIQLPQIFAGAANASARGPLAEAFLGGALATLLATPCSAPFVGTAVGFALARNPAEILVVFGSLGVGMALPFLAVAAAPGLVAWLPRPGAWMVRLRQGLGVLLLGTALWLLFTLWQVASFTITSVVAALLVGTLVFRAIITHRYAGSEFRWAGIATFGLAALAIVVASFSTSIAGVRNADADGWQSFDPVAISALVADGKTVFVDVSASWCLTCKVNELTVLQTGNVRRRLDQSGTVRMRADWSRPDPAIAAYIQHFGRFGIPLDVVYGPGEPTGKLLPEVLGSATVIRELDAAGRRAAPAGKAGS
jgi:suppressor for copper-sensitivity B